jgi:hypothetical protein
MLTALQGLPPWLIAVAALIPWVPAVAVHTARLARYSSWLALFYILGVTQSAHFGEHVAQMIQIHALSWHAAHAHGIVSALNMEVVHLVWNSSVLLGAVLLLYRFRENS